MPGRTPAEAVAAFLDPFKVALSCVAQAKITLSPGGRGTLGQVHAWTINDGTGADIGYGLRLTATMRYEIVSTEPHGYRATTHAYLYAIHAPAAELVSAHWHPVGSSPVKFAHWHVGGAALADDGVFTPRAHLPSARVSFETFVKFAISELGVKPNVPDWSERLKVSEEAFRQHRTWE